MGLSKTCYVCNLRSIEVDEKSEVEKSVVFEADEINVLVNCVPFNLHGIPFE